MEQGIFLQKLSDSLEGSKNKVITKLPVGSAIVANNYFWLHGRRPFKENKDLSRELMRIRGFFFFQINLLFAIKNFYNYEIRLYRNR